jgi:ligand-binding sensor domain-containing protein
MSSNILRLLFTHKAARFVFTLLLLWLSANREAVAQDWQQTNGPYGGIVYSFVIDSSGHIFAGTEGAGLFRSTTNGDGWTPTGLPSDITVRSLAITSSRHIFAGTGGDGVFRSRNNGASWDSVNGGLTNKIVRSLAINSSGDIFAGTDGKGVFRLTDNGVSWTQIKNGLTNLNVYALAIDSSGYVFAGTNGGGVFRSTNNGDSWTPINTGLTNLDVYALAIDSSGYVFAGTGTTGGGVYRLTDNGSRWTPVNNGLPGGRRVRSFAISQSGNIFVGIDDHGVFRLSDSGDIWDSVNAGLTNKNVRSLVIKSSGDIFAGTYAGVFNFKVNGSSWMAVNAGLTATNVRSLAINASGHIFAGTYGGVIFRSRDDGISWEPVNSGLTIQIVRSLVINSRGDIFAGTGGDRGGGGVFLSTDNGDNWTKINTGLTNIDVYALVINKANGHIWAGTASGEVFRSTNNGGNWTPVNTFPSNKAARSFAINSRGYIFAGTDSNGVFLSTDDGFSWTAVKTGLPENTIVRSLAINLNDDIFAATDGDGTFRSKTSGANWEPLNTGSMNKYVRSLVINSKGVIFAGTQGVYYSTDNGVSWVKTDLTTDLYVYALAINPSEHIFVGTSGGGVFRSVDKQAPLIGSVQYSPIVDLGKPILVTALVTDNFRVAQVNLLYREGGQSAFTSTKMDSTAASYQATISAAVVGVRGVEFTVEAIDPSNNLKAVGWRMVQVRLPAKHLSKNHVGGSSQNAYRLLSFPLASDNASVNATLSDDLGAADTTKWRLWDIDPQRRESQFPYREYPNVGDLASGKAMFLITQENKMLTSAAGVTVATLAPFQISLQPGWNMIASPFNFEIPLQNIQPESLRKDLYTYNGAWQSSPSKLQPWEGYMIKTTAPVTLTIQPSEIAANTLAKSMLKPDWLLHVKAECENAHDHDNFVGVIADAAMEWDRHERFEPPPIGEFVMISFPHRDWPRYPDVYTTDFRPRSTDGYIWDFTVDTNISGKPVTLRFDHLESVPPELEVRLIDVSLKIAQDLRRESHYVYRSNRDGGKKAFRLLVGKADFITKQSAGVIAVPTAFELTQNFPNPFNPSTSIKFGLPVKSRVSLKLYNLLGKEIATLLDGEEKDAGYHAIIWEGKDQHGKALPSGIYFYRLQVGQIVLTKKMTSLK